MKHIRLFKSEKEFASTTDLPTIFAGFILESNSYRLSGLIENIVPLSELTKFYIGENLKYQTDITSGNYSSNNYNDYVNITYIQLQEGLQYIKDYAFQFMTNLNTISFDDCKDSMGSIGKYAFSNSGLKSIQLPNSINYIGPNAFENCTYLESIDMSYTHLIEISERCFENSTIKDFIMNDTTIRIIRPYTFYRCKNLTSFGIDDIDHLYPHIEEIHEHAFDSCVRLENVRIPDETKIIGDRAFMDCVSLRSIRLPKLISLGNEVFGGCDSLEIIDYTGTREEWATLTAGLTLTDNYSVGVHYTIRCSDGNINI